MAPMSQKPESGFVLDVGSSLSANGVLGSSGCGRLWPGHPEDAVALRLRSRLPLWTPGVGVALCEGVEHLRELCAEC